MLRFLLLALSLPLILSCDVSNSRLSDYTTRLSRSLEVDKPWLLERVEPVLPRLRELRQPITESSIDLLDFLSLGGCELQGVIAERNSSLGRLATPTTRLVHELEFLAVAEACAESLSVEDPDLAELLREVIETKERELPMVIFNATLGGEEFRGFWRARGRDVMVDPEVIAAVRDLRSSIEGWMSGNYVVDRQAFVDQLDLIRRGQGGDYVQYWFDLSVYLEAADEIVNSRMSTRPLCFATEGGSLLKTAQAEIFNNVVMQFFIGGVQKDVAVLSRGSFDLFAETDRIEQLLVEALPKNYRDWQAKRQLVLDDGANAMNRHVRVLKPLLSQCGFLPTSPGS
ncbi:MAG: DUF3080 family protein [Pseudomonadales bacterium]|nr:DUF3080 family protein [Pseudomonadales bacterium]